MPTPDAQYRLVIFDAPDEPQAVRDLFAKVTNTHPTDAMQWVARVPGVWPKPLAEREVRELLEGLYDLRVAAEAWRLDKFPDFKHVRSIHEVACLDEGFRVSGIRGEPTHWIPWNKFELVSAGRIDAEDEYRDVSPPDWISAARAFGRLVTGRRPTPPRSSRAMRVPRDPAAEVILVRKDPFLALRIAATQMKYAYLGERLRETTSENFPLLLGDIVERATEAYVTRPTEIILRGEHDDEALFESTQGLIEYSMHRLLWAWYRRDRDASRDTMPE